MNNLLSHAGSWSLRGAGAALVLLMALVVSGGNGYRIWWSGLAPTLVLSPLVLLLFTMGCGTDAKLSRNAVPYFLLLIGICLTGFCSLLANGVDSEGWTFWASAYLSPVLIYLCIGVAPPGVLQPSALLLAIAAGMMFPLALGAIEYFREWGIPSATEFLFARYDLVRMEAYRRATFGNTSNTAAYLALVTPILLSACLQKEPRIRGKSLLWSILSLAVLHALIVQSRALFLVMFPALVLVAYFHGLRIRRILLIATCAVALIVLPALTALDQLADLTLGAVRGSESDQSVSERIEAMQYGLQLLSENPAFGIGPAQALTQNPHTSAHQFWIQQGSELGLFGLVLTIGLTALVLGALVRLLVTRMSNGMGALKFTFLIGPACYVCYGVIANMPLSQNVVNAWVGVFTICIAVAARSDDSFQSANLLRRPK